jgi:Flp pilus assembly protein TadG
VTRHRGERGSVSLEAVLVLPAVLVTLLVIIQVALVAHASHVADAAAREGARAVRLSGSAEAGRERAVRFLDRLGRDVVLDPEVTASAAGDSVAVEVTGRAATLLPGFDLGVSGRSSGTVERFDATGRSAP